ncbi:MAG: nitrile hydratase accessory protein [Pseudomonadaceae bacterium]|nr:nitrile hydratase accessory protein [Pseudomonadaceae bacterium]
MSTESDPTLVLDEAYRPPMANGEVIFEEPWQARAFAMAVALFERGVFTWPQFQHALIERIARFDATVHGAREYRYFDHFAGALEDVLGGLSVVSRTALVERAEQFAQRPAGHDHDHAHDGHHHH